MQLIKLNATDSTNTYLKELMASQSLEDLTAVVAKNQKKGRGQMGSQWLSVPHKNLTFSVLKKGNHFAMDNPFLLNIVTSLAIYDVLENLAIPELTIKWPNDIMSGTRKICGILIENVLSGNLIRASIIGVGLNVNQTSFPGLTNVSSLKLLMGRELDTEELLRMLLQRLRSYFEGLHKKDKLWRNYENVLFRKGVVSSFHDKGDEPFMGIIQGVSDLGKLVVKMESGRKNEFGFKEITFVL